MVTTRPPKTIVKPTALGPVANTDTKLLIYGLFQKGRVLAQDGVLPYYAQRFVKPLPDWPDESSTQVAARASTPWWWSLSRSPSVPTYMRHFAP